MRTAGLLFICAFCALIGPFIHREPAEADRLSCSPVVSIIEPNGVERLGCIDDPALAGCPPPIRPGERYADCTSVGPMRGPILAMRGQLLDVNRASEEDLRVLPKVGAGTAQRIVEGRKSEPYCSAEELSRVHGIGKKTATRLREHLSFAHPLCDRPRAR